MLPLALAGHLQQIHLHPHGRIFDFLLPCILVHVHLDWKPIDPNRVRYLLVPYIVGSKT